MSTWLLLAAAAVLLFLAIWIVVPAPNLFMLPLGVGAPEVSPLLLVISAMLAAFVLRRGFLRRPPDDLSRRKTGEGKKKLIRGIALTTVVVSALPVAQLPGVLRTFDEAMAAAGAGAPAPDVETVEPRVAHGVLVASPDGQPLSAEIYSPPPPGRFPILVQIYGGAWQRGAPANDVAFARHFASRGYVVMAIDYRHAPRWQWPAQRDDVRTALEWIAAHASEYGGDTTRIAIIGRSAGAQLALMAAYQAGGPSISAVVSYYGPTDLAEGWRRPPRPDPLDVRAVLEAFLGGTPDQVPDRYRDASPVTYAAASVPPTLLVYGTRDHIVEARFGRQLHERLRAAGATSVLLEIPWAEHAFDAVPNGLSARLALSYTERFLSAVLRR